MSEYIRPSTLQEALAARAQHPDYTVLAGGTDLYVEKHNQPDPAGIIDVWGLSEMCGILTEDGGLRIGGATTYRELIESELVQTKIPILAEAAREVGALQIQSRGTIAGNMATSSPVGDTLPVLLALRAVVELASDKGSRKVAYADYCTGYRKTELSGDELIVAVHIPEQPEGAVQFWRKVGTRRAQSISKCMVAGVATCADGKITSLTMGFGAVADRPIRIAALEEAVLGKTGAEAAALSAAVIDEAITPITDIRSTADYRHDVVKNLVADFLRSLD